MTTPTQATVPLYGNVPSSSSSTAAATAATAVTNANTNGVEYDDDDYDRPPKPPIRVSSSIKKSQQQTEQENNFATGSRNTSTSVDSVADVDDHVEMESNKVLNPIEKPKPKRPIWFRFAYVAVCFTILGIITVVAGTILLVLRLMKFETIQSDEHHYIYFGKKIPKRLAQGILFVGLTVAFFGYLSYKFALIRIDRYLKSLMQYNEKMYREERERNDPLMMRREMKSWKSVNEDDDDDEDEEEEEEDEVDKGQFNEPLMK